MVCLASWIKEMHNGSRCQLVVFGFKATLTAKVIAVISWPSMMHMCFLAYSHQYYHNSSFQSHRLLFSHTSAEVRGENTPEIKFPSTRNRTHNYQVMSLTRSPLSHPGRSCCQSMTQIKLASNDEICL